MPALNIDIILVGLFLITNLAIGLWYGKEVKSVRDYAISEEILVQQHLLQL
ncbi:sodium/pantothenate symporter domain protein [Orientia tsutsugamushi str. UT76]|nr:sodium/pantothenate symporter domain protein [Orientia tsutsugamushi str. UT76]